MSFLTYAITSRNTAVSVAKYTIVLPEAVSEAIAVNTNLAIKIPVKDKFLENKENLESPLSRTPAPARTCSPQYAETDIPCSEYS